MLENLSVRNSSVVFSVKMKFSVAATDLTYCKYIYIFFLREGGGGEGRKNLSTLCFRLFYIFWSQALDVARQVTGENDNRAAKVEFLKMMNSSRDVLQQWFDSSS